MAQENENLEVCPKCGGRKWWAAKQCYKCAGMTAHRKVKDIEAVPFLKPLFRAILQMRYPYNSEQRALLWHRDQAAACIMTSYGPRVSEYILIQALQFTRDEDTRFLILRNIKSKKGGELRPKLRFFREGDWAPITAHIETYLEKIPDPESFIMPRCTGGLSGKIMWDEHLTRQQVWYIFKHGGKIPGTDQGFFNHYFRSVSETKWGEILGNSFLLAKLFGVTERAVGRYVHPELGEEYDAAAIRAR